MVETVVALGVFAVIGVAFLLAVATSTKATGTLDDGVQAEALARSYLEAIKECGYETKPDDYADCALVLNIDVPDRFVVSIDLACSNDIDFTWVEPCVVTDSFERVTIGVSHGGRPVLSLTTYRRDDQV